MKPATTSLTMKTCTRCGLTKGREGFHTRRRSGDGLTSQCRQCHNALVANNNAKRRVVIRGSDRQLDILPALKQLGFALEWQTSSMSVLSCTYLGTSEPIPWPSAQALSTIIGLDVVMDSLRPDDGSTRYFKRRSTGGRPKPGAISHGQK